MSSNLATTNVSTIIDEEGSLRVKGKNESDHNTIITEIKINSPRKPVYLEKWKISNTNGWKEFNKSIHNWADKNIVDKNQEITYEEFENKLKQEMVNHIGKKNQTR